ncbi:MAG TPA: hypothetical protein VF171_07275 [Trueperaceae bacterium]
MLIPILDDALGVVRRVKELDPALFVAWNPACRRYEVHDREARGSTLVMRVQEPDGSFRRLDARVIETLRRNRRERFGEVFAELERAEERREREWGRRTTRIAEGLADDLRFAGRLVVGGVAVEPGRDAGGGAV